jgi:hypothetical protein
VLLAGTPLRQHLHQVLLQGGAELQRRTEGGAVQEKRPRSPDTFPGTPGESVTLFVDDRLLTAHDATVARIGRTLHGGHDAAGTFPCGAEGHGPVRRPSRRHVNRSGRGMGGRSHRRIGGIAGQPRASRHRGSPRDGPLMRRAVAGAACAALFAATGIAAAESGLGSR